MDSRTRLRDTFRFAAVAPPRYEAEFSDEVLRAWNAKGALNGRAPESFFELDRRETVPVEWRRKREEKAVVHSEADLPHFQRSYDPNRSDCLLADWNTRITQWRNRDHALAIAPWNEGFFQVLGISDGRTLTDALTLLYEQPAIAQAQMDHYLAYLETLLDRILPEVTPDYAVYYEPIASRHGPVISPETYRKFVFTSLQRVIARLTNHGVRFHFIWTTGRIHDLIPTWLEAGINGFVLHHTRLCGLNYTELRRKFGQNLLLFGGVDWQTVMNGTQAIAKELDSQVRPLLEQGGYVPHLDDTIREYIPFEHYQYHREHLDALTRGLSR
ncbi:MAG: hypothetical protein HY706_09585 [Candidatus Hydrogenedentes bacterium]|nr:hypothetical protein [Candidatus Hydrogenedentota bacterium]